MGAAGGGDAAAGAAGDLAAAGAPVQGPFCGQCARAPPGSVLRSRPPSRPAAAR